VTSGATQPNRTGGSSDGCDSDHRHEDSTASSRTSLQHGAVRRLTVGQAIVEYLQAQYSERDGHAQRLIPRMIGIFGHGNVAGLGQGLEERGTGLPFVQGRNEQSMVHTAAGFAKTTARRSTLACTTSLGPGATNMITGAAGATINRLPVLLLPSDTYATRHQGPVLQQLEHPLSADMSVNDCFRPVSRFFDRISRPEQLLTALPEAMRVLTSATEAGAVVIALPQDLQAHAYPFPARFFDERAWRIERPEPSPARISEAVDLLKRASRPVIIAGGGVQYSEAQRALAAFASRFGIPVAETFGGKGAIEDEAWYSIGGGGVDGNTAANRILANADLVIAVGTRLTDFTTASRSLFQDPDVRFISINVVERDAQKESSLPIVADARQALLALTAAGEAAELKPNMGYEAHVRAAVEDWAAERQKTTRPVGGETMSQAQQIAVINDAARAGDVIVTAAGLPAGDLLQLWDATSGRSCMIEHGYSCMGYEIPGALGVRMAQSGGEVYALVGDGTFLLNPGDLVTATQERLKLTVVISENHGFESIARLQLATTGRQFGNEFRQRDGDRLHGPYVDLRLDKVAEGLGATAKRATTPDELRDALDQARSMDGTCVIVCETEPRRYAADSGAWWDVSVAEVSDIPEIQALRADYDRKRADLQRFYY
jgi:3D-(3,5/4)-trihydroxycyclohexane-1,2-dione acylhydrolase (decyclizing)